MEIRVKISSISISFPSFRSLQFYIHLFFRIAVLSTVLNDATNLVFRRILNTNLYHSIALLHSNFYEKVGLV